MKTLVAILITLLHFIIYFIGVYTILVAVFDFLIVFGVEYTAKVIWSNLHFSYSIITLIIMIALELFRDQFD
jgi:hypothetical protein